MRKELNDDGAWVALYYKILANTIALISSIKSSFFEGQPTPSLLRVHILLFDILREV